MLLWLSQFCRSPPGRPPPPLSPQAPLLSPAIHSVYNADPESPSLHLHCSSFISALSLLTGFSVTFLFPFDLFTKQANRFFKKCQWHSVPRYLNLFTISPFMKDQMLSTACKTLSQLASAFFSRLFCTPHPLTSSPPHLHGSDIQAFFLLFFLPPPPFQMEADT